MDVDERVVLGGGWLSTFGRRARCSRKVPAVSLDHAGTSWKSFVSAGVPCSCTNTTTSFSTFL